MNQSPLLMFVVDRFAGYAGVPAADLLRPEVTMADVIARSPSMHNSIDLMEAFARTSNALKKEHGVRIKLPTFPLDTPMVTVLAAFETQLAAAVAS